MTIPILFQVPTRTRFLMIGYQIIKSDFSAIQEILTCRTTTSYKLDEKGVREIMKLFCLVRPTFLPQLSGFFWLKIAKNLS